MNKLCEAAKAVGISTDDRFRQGFKRFYELIESANGRFNLTGVSGWERVRNELFIRSLNFFAPVAGGYISAVEWFPGRRILDVGTGAGIPGLVLKLAVPEVAITLLDSSHKKTAFLREVVESLELENVTVVTGRAEEMARDSAHRESYDLVVSRGVARLAELAELTLPFASIGGAVVAAKGPDIDQEIKESEFASETLGAAPALIADVASAGDNGKGKMVYWMKISSTPPEFPRRNGVPHSNPLISETVKRDMASAT